MTQAAANADPDIVVIGAGFGGIGTAIALRAAGRRDFAVLERAADLGGTWRDNRYPGCACDVPSHLYSYAFAPKPDWSRRYSGWDEILGYLREVARRHGVLEHIRYHHAVTRLAFDPAASRWRIELAQGTTLSARIVISAVGGFSRPQLPAFAGREQFRGRAFHTARWDPAADLAGLRVAVIGTGASAIQIVPQIAPRAARLHLFQRTPPWVVPRRDRAQPPWAQRLYARVPVLQRLRRAGQYAVAESRILGFVKFPGLRRLAELSARAHLRRQIADPALRARLVPGYPIGCKRVLISDDYYPALARPNVELVTDTIARITPAGVVTADGAERAVDAVVFATGFEVTGPGPIETHGPGGRSLAVDWREGGEAYLGVAVAGYPNLFLLGGPNSGLAHSSVIHMLESQIRYVVEALALLDRSGAARIEVRREVQERYNRGLDRILDTSVWACCNNWYRGHGGRVSALWPDFTFRFRRLTRRVDPSDFLLGDG